MIRFLVVLACSAVAVAAIVPRAGVVPGDLPSGYQPRHKGGVDLATGLYTREDEDIIVRGAPTLTLRRTYLSNYRASRQFGIGTTHNGEMYLSGDFKQISLIEAAGSRITFERRPGFASLLSAVFDHRTSPSEWVGSELRFAALGWRLKRRDGSDLTFMGCGRETTCSLIQSRDADGGTINYRRDQSRRLTRMESGERWIAFEYDALDRITRAHSSTGSSVHYQYDAQGRLWQVFTDDGRPHRYTYTDRDQLASIQDPGTTIENSYDANGRVIRQVSHRPGDPDPLVFTLSYQLKDGKVVGMGIARSDGEASRYTFNEHRYAVSEEWSLYGKRVATFTYHRNLETQVATAITIACVNRDAIATPVTHAVSGGDDRRTRRELESACLTTNQRFR